MTPSEEPPGTVFIGEHINEVGNPSGRVGAHWEAQSGQDWLQGPEDTTFADALAWGRQRSTVVLIHTAEDEWYSAGSVNPDSEEFAPWPEDRTLTVRRLATKWWVAVLVPASDTWTESDTNHVLDLLQRSPLIAEAHSVVRTETTPRVECKVRANSPLEAIQLVDTVLPRGLYNGHLSAGLTTTTRLVGLA